MNRFERKLATISPGGMNVLVLAVGVILVLVGALLAPSNTTWKQLLLGVGASVIASAVVAYLTSHYLRSQNDTIRLMDSWRVDGLFRTRAEANQHANKHLASTKQLDVIAFGLRSFRDRQDRLIRSLVESGLQLRILTLDPKSQFVTARTKSEKLKEGQLKKEINDMIAWVEELRTASDDPSKIDVRTYDTINLDFYFRMDGIVFLGPYLHGQSSQQTVTYSFARGGIGFEYWERYFEDLWQDNSFCRSALPNGNDEDQ